jgi:hypothetical protein
MFILDIFTAAEMKDLVPVERIASKIYLIRGQKVMLDRDLAELRRNSMELRRKFWNRQFAGIARDFLKISCSNWAVKSSRIGGHNLWSPMEQKYDQQFQVVFDAIKLLLEVEEKPKPKIGFTVKERVKAYGRKRG